MKANSYTQDTKWNGKKTLSSNHGSPGKAMTTPAHRPSPIVREYIYYDLLDCGAIVLCRYCKIASPTVHKLCKGHLKISRGGGREKRKWTESQE